MVVVKASLAPSKDLKTQINKPQKEFYLVLGTSAQKKQELHTQICIKSEEVFPDVQSKSPLAQCPLIQPLLPGTRGQSPPGYNLFLGL